MKKFLLLSVTLLGIMAAIASCNSCGDKESSSNPLLTEWDTPFGTPPFDKISSEHYLPAMEEAFRELDKEIKEIVDNKDAADFNNTILAYDNSGKRANDIMLVFSLVAAADTNPEMQRIEEKIYPLESARMDDIMLNEALFAKIKTVYDDRHSAGLDALELRLTEKVYKNFVRSGANLVGPQREEFKKINQDLSLATLKFGKNLLEENARFEMLLEDNQLSGIPTGVRNSASQAAKDKGHAGKYLFDIGKPSMIPFISYSDNRELREELYKGYIEKCDHDDELDNKGVINEIMSMRTRRAHLLGYESHAEYVLDDIMAKNPVNVYNLLDEVWVPALDRAKQELAAMTEIKMRETGNSDFASWDWWYYAEKVRKSEYDLNQDALRNYFSLDNTRIGVFELCNRLYGITFRPVTIPVYHEDCVTYEVLDIDGSHLGVLIMDFFPRPGRKSPGAWCGDYREPGYKDGDRVSPITTIVCNFTPPSGSTPSLLTIDEVETFFHEFGHALHSLFSKVQYRGLLGVERDFVELPSQIMENWAMEPEMLRSYAIHYQNGSVIPDAMIERLRRSDKFNQGFMTVESIAAAYSDMDIHTMKEYAEIDVSAFERKVLNDDRGLIAQIEPRYRYPYFAHIFSGGYSAGYYSYVWAEVLDKDAFQAFVESGELFSRKVAAKFREEILSKGGTADGMTLYRNFRGHEPSRLPLMKARGLVEE